MAEDIQKREPDTPQTREGAVAEATFVPDVDIIEHEDAFELTADMPGVDDSTIDVDLDKNVLTLRGRYAEEAPEGYEMAYREYRTGAYERVFTLGNQIDRDNVKATVKNGVLKLHLPKVKEQQPRRIEVTTE